MKWSIILIENGENKWYINYIQNKLLSQIKESKLEKSVEILVIDKISKFKEFVSKLGEYINIIDEYIEVSDDYINSIYNEIKNNKKDCVGFKGILFIGKRKMIFNQISENYKKEEKYLPISKFNPLNKNIIIKNIDKYLISNDLSGLILNKINIDNLIIFKQMKIIVEIPHDDIKSGGVQRMMKIVMELPYYNPTSGGVLETINMASNFSHNVFIRFQKLCGIYPQIPISWTVGLPDNTFPVCDVCITYSDNPYLEQLVNLPQVKKVLLYMLSYGMAIERERPNVLNNKVTVMCSTKKLEKLISDEGVNVHRIGFALDDKKMIKYNNQRKNYLAILYHPNDNKKYVTSVEVANKLYKNKIIDGVISFGTSDGYDNSLKPLGLVKHYSNANKDEICEIFNLCKCFLMPSISEGLNLTPMESTLCGCPAILCDGAIDEVYFDNENCFVVKKEDQNSMSEKIENVMLNFDKYSDSFRENMVQIVKDFTWSNVIKKLDELL